MELCHEIRLFYQILTSMLSVQASPHWHINNAHFGHYVFHPEVLVEQYRN